VPVSSPTYKPSSSENRIGIVLSIRPWATWRPSAWSVPCPLPDAASVILKVEDQGALAWRQRLRRRNVVMHDACRVVVKHRLVLVEESGSAAEKPALGDDLPSALSFRISTSAVMLNDLFLMSGAAPSGIRVMPS